MFLPKVFFCLIVLSSVAQVRLSAQKLGTYSRHALSYERKEGVYDDFDQEGKVVTKGISYGFTRGVGVSRAIPLAVEFGGRLAWTHGVDKDFYYKISRKDFLSVVLPINAAYRISLFWGAILLWRPSWAPLSDSISSGVTITSIAISLMAGPIIFSAGVWITRPIYFSSGET